MTGGNYASGGTGENAVTIDLGKLYDIEAVKVWHYYPDGSIGRTYRGTKTEVSRDGKTWTVLFDSKIEGTYVEPKDGSGRRYVVGKKGNADIDFFLNLIFKELGIEENIQINKVTYDATKIYPKINNLLLKLQNYVSDNKENSKKLEKAKKVIIQVKEKTGKLITKLKNLKAKKTTIDKYRYLEKAVQKIQSKMLWIF